MLEYGRDEKVVFLPCFQIVRGLIIEDIEEIFMGLDWIYDHPFTSTLICAAIELWICHRLFERFFLYKGIGRLKKRELKVLQNLRQTKAVRCVATMGKWRLYFLQIALVIATVTIFYFGKGRLHDFFVVERTPQQIGKVHKVEATLQKGSRGSSYYVYDHLVEHQGKFKKKFQVIRSRTRRKVGDDFGFHEDGARWIEHTNKQHILLIGIFLPFAVFILYFASFFCTIYPQVKKAVKRARPLGEVTILATHRQRIKNGWNVYMWFLFEDILYSITLDGLNKKSAIKMEDLEGERIAVYELRPSFPGFSPRKYLSKIGLSPQQQLKAKFLAFDRDSVL